MSSDSMSEAMGYLQDRQGMVEIRPTTREVFLSGENAEQEALERAFFCRVLLPNGTVKTTHARRVDDLNSAAFPFIQGVEADPVQIMDVGVSSGVSTLEWYESLCAAGVNCQITATDLTVYTSLISLRPNLAALIDHHGNILHLDVLGRGAPGKAAGLQGFAASLIRGLFRTAMLLDGNLAPLKGDTRAAANGWLLRCEPVTLLTKRFAQHSGLRVVEDDLLGANRNEFLEAFHVLRAANILNRAYFSAAVLLDTVKKLKQRLKKNGLLIVCRTTDEGVNNATIFRLNTNSRFDVLKRLGEGSEIEELVAKA